MERTERFYRIEQLLRERPPVPVAVFLEELEISIATFKRDLEYLRSRLNAPIVWDNTGRGYRFATSPTDAVHELPGLWLNASEIHALLTMRHLLKDLQPGLLEPHIQPLLTRLNTLLESGPHSLREVENRVRVFHLARRRYNPRHFDRIASALLQRKRLRICHFNRRSDETLEREVSPQRLIHYRENWYLDAWCHLRNAIRSFAVDAIETAVALEQPAREVADAELDRVLAAGYGIFSGEAVKQAVLRFSRERARWVGCEIWHPEQKGTLDADGRYRLEVPYSDDRELLMDILHHGPEVEVLAPPALRERALAAIRATARVYEPATEEK